MQRPVKQKKCKVCRELFTPRNTLQVACSPGCALDHAQGIKAKEYKAQAREKKARFLESDARFQKAKAQKSFNEFIRIRDAHLGCVSCDKPADWGGQWHAGHYKTVGARPDLRFDENNCHKQCSVCNNYLSGNLANYRLELERRIGISEIQRIEQDTIKGTPLRATDYIAIHKMYQAKIKELRSSGAPIAPKVGGTP